MKKNILSVLTIFIISISLIACSSKTPDPEIFYDVSMAQKMFPGLSGITNVAIETEYLGDQTRSPGPSDIKYRGLIELDYNISNTYHNEYQWVETTFQPYTEYIVTNMHPTSVWCECNDFTKDMMDKGLIGQVYFYDNVIWFEVMTY